MTLTLVSLVVALLGSVTVFLVTGNRYGDHVDAIVSHRSSPVALLGFLGFITVPVMLMAGGWLFFIVTLTTLLGRTP